MRICIHTVIKNELDEYLKAWLDHHAKMVNHLFVFEDIDSHSHKHVTDQYSNVTLMSVLDLFDNKDRIIKMKEKHKITQGEYLVNGLQMIQSLNEYDWCLPLDIDEFITLEEPYKSITDVLGEFQAYDGVLIQWMNYGANGRIYKPDYNGVDYREFYTKRGEDSAADAFFAINTKVAYNLNRMERNTIGGIHCPNGNNWVKTNFVKKRKINCYDKMYLKHYVTKSFEEYLWKLFKRGMHCYDRHRKIDDFFQINPDMKDKRDECMRFMDQYLNENNIQLNV